MTKIKQFLSWFLKRSLVAKIVIIALVLGGGYFAISKIVKNKSSQPQYQTAQAEKGILVVSVSASGNITSGNNINITTNASGTVDQVFVKNGDKVTQGQKIATITLDQDSLQRQSQTWSSYLSAKNSLFSAQNNYYSLQAAEFKANVTFVNDAVMRGLAVTDPTYIQENAAWLQAEASYKNQAAVIQQVQSSLNSAWLSYQQISSTVVAPTSGVISNLIVAPGSLVSGSSSTTSSSSGLQTLGTISKESQTQAVVNLSEIDVVNVLPGQKVSMTMDAFSTKTFTGKILVIDTNGQVSSGVTTYPATIVFDTSGDNIYPNMAVDAKIITKVKSDVILVPSAAVQTSNGQSTVGVVKNNKENQVNVEIGDSNDTQTEIISGVSEGDTVVTSVITSTSTNNSSTSSPFGGLNSGFGGGGGGAVRGINVGR